MNKNPESKTASQDLSNCLNPKPKRKTKMDIYWEVQEKIKKEIFGE